MNIDGQTYGANDAAARPSPSALTSDFNTFLRMLTVQMQNQNPLNPMEASDFAVQLATFSQVEQQVRANDLLTGLKSSIAELGLAQLASWVGIEARVNAPVTLPAAPVELAFAPDPSAETSVIVVRNLSGREVQRLTPARGQTSLTWSGEGLAGGSYQFELLNYSAGTVVSTGVVEHYARVREAGTGPEGVTLTLASGSTIAASGASAFRTPPDPVS